MTRTAKIATALTLGLASVTLVAGCSSASSTGEAAKDLNASAAATTAAAPAETAEDKTPDTVKLGETAKFPDGVEVGISAPESYTPSQYAAGNTFPNNVVWTVTITNGSDKPFDPALFNMTVQSGGQEGSQVFDSNSEGGVEVGTQATTTILPGKSTSWKAAWSVADANDLTAEVSPNAFDYEPVIFTK